MRRVVFLFFSILSLFLSCSEFTVPEETTARNAGFVTLSAFEEGRILKPGEKIKYGFSFTEEATTVVSYRISVVDLITDEIISVGEPILLINAAVDAESETTKEEKTAADSSEKALKNELDTDYKGTQIVSESLPEGFYAFVFSFLDNQGKEVGSVSASFFVSLIDLKVNSLGSYPAVIYPGGESLLYTDITAPEGFDSDVVWTCNGVEIYRTRLKDMAPAVKWRAPSDKTAVEMSVGVYPCDPPVGKPFEFAPPVSLSSTIFISVHQPAESVDFRPDAAYDLLFHFRGELNDFSPFAKGRSITVKGNPQLAYNSNVFGYSFADGAAVEVSVDDESLFGSENGILIPSVIDFRLNLKSTCSGNILLVKDFSEKTLFSLSKEDQKLHLTSELGSKSLIQTLNLSDYIKSDLLRLSFSVFQDTATKQYSFVWGLDGYSVCRTAVAYDGTPRIDGKTVVIGGESGYTGVVDEFGIFRIGSDSEDSLFAEAVRKRFRGECLFADDFIGNTNRSSYRKFPKTIPVGFVTLGEGDVLETTAYEVANDRFSFQVAVAEENFNGGTIAVKAVTLDVEREWRAETTVVSLNLKDKTLTTAFGDFSFTASGSLCGLYRFDFQKTADGWFCELAGKKFPVLIPDGAAVAAVAFAEASEAFAVDSLVLLGTLSGQADLYQVPVSLNWQP